MNVVFDKMRVILQNKKSQLYFWEVQILSLSTIVINKVLSQVLF